MAMVKKSISVTDQQESWIKAQIANGYYGNDSEVIRELIRERQLAQRRETPEEIAVIRKKLETAEARGFTDQSAEEILAEIKEELRLDGKL
jgi:antitoxin ParD1/3/4